MFYLLIPASIGYLLKFVKCTYGISPITDFELYKKCHTNNVHTSNWCIILSRRLCSVITHTYLFVLVHNLCIVVTSGLLLFVDFYVNGPNNRTSCILKLLFWTLFQRNIFIQYSSNIVKRETWKWAQERSYFSVFFEHTLISLTMPWSTIVSSVDAKKSVI